MTLSYELYWSFRSPYSYLVVPRLVELDRDFDVRCIVRPVYPIAVRTPEFFEAEDPLWVPYLMKDIVREAAYLGLALRWPRPDPVTRGPDGSYRVEQPYIHRLTYLGVAAAEQGRGLAFLDEVSRLLWGGTAGWNEDAHLAGAAARAGLDWDELSGAVDCDPQRFEAIIQDNQTAQRAAGHWGVPLMVFDGEPFFGQDRFDQLKWRMMAAGLAAR